MKRIITLFFATILAGQVLATDNYDFSAKCSSGQILYYKITSDNEPYTIRVAYPNYKSSSDYYYGYTKPSGELIIPSKVLYLGNEYSVTSIGVHAFHDCSGLTSITIPTTVTTIANDAFSNCDKLTTITIPFADNYVPKSVEKIIITGGSNIPDEAFANYKNLSSITISSSVTSIGVGAFSGCIKLTSVTIPESVTTPLGVVHFLNVVYLKLSLFLNQLQLLAQVRSIVAMNLRRSLFPNQLQPLAMLHFVIAMNLHQSLFLNQLQASATILSLGVV